MAIVSYQALIFSLQYFGCDFGSVITNRNTDMHSILQIRGKKELFFSNYEVVVSLVLIRSLFCTVKSSIMAASYLLIFRLEEIQDSRSAFSYI